MLHSEKRSLVRFLIIYLLSTFLLFSLASWIFYTSTRDHLIQTQRERLTYEAQKLHSALRLLHQSNAPLLSYPSTPPIDSAIFDSDQHYIFGTKREPMALGVVAEGVLHYEQRVEPYYLGAAHLMVTQPLDQRPIERLQHHILLFMLGAGVFFLLLGYFLGRLFVAPMRDSLQRLNRFIQDTTHELNTPISTILTNIEMIETFGGTLSHESELQRIAIASKTLSRIYDDLTYLNLNHHYHREVVMLDLSRLVAERMVYFKAMADAKGIVVTIACVEAVMQKMDRNDAIRLIDNLLSNAIKYNRPHGRLIISLDTKRLSIQDTGIGIAPKALGEIAQRFRRANSSEGGFGIGLHIVTQVCQSYQLTLSINSVEHQGTEVIIVWEE